MEWLRRCTNSGLSTRTSAIAVSGLFVLLCKWRWDLKQMRRVAGRRAALCPKMHFSGQLLPKTALGSFPGSENTWIRHLLQLATRVVTCSISWRCNMLGSIHWNAPRQLDIVKLSAPQYYVVPWTSHIVLYKKRNKQSLKGRLSFSGLLACYRATVKSTHLVLHQFTMLYIQANKMSIFISVLMSNLLIFLKRNVAINIRSPDNKT